MKKSNERIKHAIHNAEVCQYLKLKGEYSDWVITTAFYSALHFVSYKIFPFEVASIANKKTVIESLDQYFNYAGKNKSKHDLLCTLVDKVCDKISEEYAWLKDMSMTARYGYYHTDPEIASKAVRLMEAIRDCCVTKEELKAA